MNNTKVVLGSSNHMPVAAADISTIAEDTASAVAGNVKTNDTLGDGTAVQHTITWGSEVGKYGTLTTGTDGSYSYSLHNDLAAVQQLAVGDSLTETFSYTLTDVDGQTSTATLTITITGTNDGPVGNATAVLPAGSRGPRLCRERVGSVEGIQ